MAELALVVDDVRQRRWMENQLVRASHHVLLSCGESQLKTAYSALQDIPEAWLVLLSSRRVEYALEFIADVSPAPTLVLDAWPEERDALAPWLARVLKKLNAALLPTLTPAAMVAPQQVWLLGASLGGPEAVTAFLAALPADLPVAFVYVQHIEEAFDRALLTNLNRNTPFEAMMFSNETRLGVGQVLIVAPERKPRFLPFHRVIGSNKPWRGKYRPCVDDVALDLARLYRSNLGLIVLSGTCNDGEQAAIDVHRYGGQVWTQAPSSCLCATMPEAVNRTGVVGVSGTPVELAATLASRLRAAKD